MWFFKGKVDKLSYQLQNLLLGTLSLTANSFRKIYEQDEQLSSRLSDAAVGSFKIEFLCLLLHFTCVMSVRRLPRDTAEKVFSRIYAAIDESISKSPMSWSSIREIIDDRLERYSMIENKTWFPVGSWWLGNALPDNSITQGLVLFGDYLTYELQLHKIPIGDDIEPVLLHGRLLDPEFLLMPHLVFDVISPTVDIYIEQVAKILEC